MVLIGIAVYLNQVVVPTIDPPFVPTPTPTRAPESYLNEAEALFSQGKLLQAVDIYQQAVLVRPDDAGIYVAMARAQVFAGRYTDAQTSAEDALLLNPNNSMAHAVRGWALYFQEDFLAAEAALRRAIELDANNAVAHAYYAEMLADLFVTGRGELGDIDKAIEESRLADNLAPNSLEALRARAYILEVTGNYEEAIRKYQAAIAINENIADLHLALGRTYLAQELYAQAREEFTRANALNPSDYLPDLYLSRTYFRTGEYAKAVQFAEQSVKDEPTLASLRGNLGVMYYRNVQFSDSARELALVVNGGQTEDGQPIQPIALANDIRIGEYYSVFGLALVKLNRCGEALPVFRDILDKIPTLEFAVFNAQEGLRMCQEALTGSPTQTPAPATTP